MLWSTTWIMTHNKGGSQILQTQGAIALITKLLNTTRFWLIGSIKVFSLIIKLWWLGGGTAIKGLFAFVCDENAWYQNVIVGMTPGWYFSFAILIPLWSYASNPNTMSEIVVFLRVQITPKCHWEWHKTPTEKQGSYLVRVSKWHPYLFSLEAINAPITKKLKKDTRITTGTMSSRPPPRRLLSLRPKC